MFYEFEWIINKSIRVNKRLSKWLFWTSIYRPIYTHQINPKNAPKTKTLFIIKLSQNSQNNIYISVDHCHLFYSFYSQCIPHSRTLQFFKRLLSTIQLVLIVFTSWFQPVRYSLKLQSLSPKILHNPEVTVNNIGTVPMKRKGRELMKVTFTSVAQRVVLWYTRVKNVWILLLFIAI